MIEKAFVTGCDQNAEWMLPWFIENYNKYVKNIPLIIYDFGMSSEIKEKYGAVSFHHPLNKMTHPWFLKPEAILDAQAHSKVWLDVDCEIVGRIETIFDEIKAGVLNMVIDHPWSQRSGEKWHNSGVVGVKGRTDTLYEWYMECKKLNPYQPEFRGDQEVLHAIKKRWGFVWAINDLPHKYNTLRLDIQDETVPKDPLIYHWTGPKGKEIIRNKMK